MLTDEDEKKQVAYLEAAGWRPQSVNGVVVWTLRGFDGIYSLTEAFGWVCQGWAAQRLAALVLPWYKDRSVWLTIAAASGGVVTALASELAGSQNHILSAAGMAIASAAPFVSKYVNERARQAAALDMRPPPSQGQLPQPPR